MIIGLLGNNMIKKGTHGVYTWFQVKNNYLTTLIDSIPELVVGKYVAIASYEGEHYKLRSGEIKSGWQQINDIALSPVVKQAGDLPNNQFDEWYIFSKLIPFIIKESFINYGGFSLSKRKMDNPFLPAAYKKQLTENSTLADDRESRFWKQIELVEPETYIAENEKLIVVTRNQELIRMLDGYFGRKPLSGLGSNRMSTRLRQTFVNLPKKI